MLRISFTLPISLSQQIIKTRSLSDLSGFTRYLVIWFLCEGFKCEHGKIQNQNELVNNTIWTRV